MKKYFAILAIACISSLMAADGAVGKKLFETKCVTCHGKGAEGNGENPKLNGQKADILASKIRQHRQSASVMKFVTANITDDEAATLAEYIASLPVTKAIKNKKGNENHPYMND